MRSKTPGTLLATRAPRKGLSKERPTRPRQETAGQLHVEKLSFIINRRDAIRAILAILLTKISFLAAPKAGVVGGRRAVMKYDQTSRE